MRILIMVHALGIGGAERVASSWANGLSRRGHEVFIRTDICSVKQSYPTDKGVKIIQNRIYRNKVVDFIHKVCKKIFFSPFTVNELSGILKDIRPDVIINVLYDNKLELLIANRLTGLHTPVIMTDHNAYERPEGHEMPLRQKRCKFRYNKYFERVTVLTNRDKEIMDSKGFRNVEVLHNPLFLKTADTVAEKDNVILAVGRIDAWNCKGFDLLINAWNKIFMKYPDWKLKIVGSGSDKNLCYLKQLALPTGDAIEFSPFTTEIENEYKMASIFVLSSRYEGWGLVLVEAMSQGCAVIACDYLGRQKEVVENGVNGMIIPVEDSNAIAESISNLIENDELRTRLQMAAPSSVERFSESDIAEKLESIIKDVIRS